MTNDNKLIVLFLAANPVDTDRLKLDEEIRSVDSALRMTRYWEYFDLRSHWAVRPSDLQELLLRYKPHVVHFSGHGSPTNEILLKGDAGEARPMAPQALSSLFGILKDNLKCVVLNACFSEKQARSIAEHVDCVVGMSRAILDIPAIEFATAFYRGLGYGRSVQTAFDLGCSQIGLAGRGIVRRDLALISAKIGQGSEYIAASESAIPQLVSLRRDPSDIVLVGHDAGGSVTGTSTSASPTTGVVGKLTKLTGLQFKQFQSALLSAFDQLGLQQMVLFELSENLNVIAGGPNLSAITFNLIEWAQRTGNLDRLLNGALAAVPGNTELQTFAKIVRG